MSNDSNIPVDFASKMDKADAEEAIIQLLNKLNEGIRSAEDEGWLSEVEVRTHFRNRRNEHS